eukprot:scaffold659_cov260-Chaetoceros_neogracile.AAC.7
MLPMVICSVSAMTWRRSWRYLYPSSTKKPAKVSLVSEYQPMTPGYSKVLLPCFIVRWLQVHLGMWLEKQWPSKHPSQKNLEMPMPANSQRAKVGQTRTDGTLTTLEAGFQPKEHVGIGGHACGMTWHD